MKLARFWVRQQAEAYGPTGMTRVACRGWSDESIEDALRQAAMIAGRLAQRIADGRSARMQYLYGERPLPEPVLEQFDSRAVITRNIYGALVLNTRGMMFLDIDQTGQPRVLAELDRVVQRNGLAVRVYRTASGFRGIVTNRSYSPTSPESEEILSEFQCDPLYIRLCKLQESFRARLSPKPWRCGLAAPPAAFPFENARAETRFRDWLVRYNANAARCATCRYVATIGGDRVEPAFGELIARHDAETRTGSEQPLA